MTRILPILDNCQTSSEHSCIQQDGSPEVRCQAVLGDAGNCTGSVHDRVLEAGFNHVPSKNALETEQECHASELGRHGRGQLLPGRKISQGKYECDANDAAQDTMAPFHVKDVLKLVQRNRVIDPVGIDESTLDTIGVERCADSLNSGVALYFSNSVFQSTSLSGGMIPVMGRHSVMLRPDSVRRVTPPTTMTAKTSADEKRSQRPTAGGASTGSLGAAASG